MYTDFFDQEFSYDLFKDLSHPRTITPMTESVFGTMLEGDLSRAHVLEDPLIKHFAPHTHFMEKNMTRRRTRMALRIKFFVADLFSRKPKAPTEKKKKRK